MCLGCTHGKLLVECCFNRKVFNFCELWDVFFPENGSMLKDSGYEIYIIKTPQYSLIACLIKHSEGKMINRYNGVEGAKSHQFKKLKLRVSFLILK